jgi:F-type H+-transporting ATPase subunit delta
MKSEFSEIASQYAAATIELAEKEKIEEQVLSDLESIATVVSQTPEFDAVLKHPAIAPVERKRLLVELFQGKINDLTLRLVELLADKRRLELLSQIAVEYRKLYQINKNTLSASLTSADPLSDQEKEHFKVQLAKRFGKQLDLEISVDPSLLGGLVLRVGDEVIDGSVKGKLRALEKTLLSV